MMIEIEDSIKESDEAEPYLQNKKAKCWELGGKTIWILEVQFRKFSTRITGALRRQNRKNGGKKIIKEIIIEHYPEYKHKSFWIVLDSPVHLEQSHTKAHQQEIHWNKEKILNPSTERKEKKKTDSNN